MSMLGNDGNKTESAAMIRARIGIYLALSALSLLLNGSFLIVLWKSWSFVKGRRITYHVTNLAISDSIVGASTFSHYISIIAAGRETTLSSAFTVIVWTATLTSLLAVCLMAIERAICIKKPYTWNKILPLKRILKFMVGNWLLTLVLAIIMHFYTLTMMFVLLVLFCIPVLVTAVVYTAIYVEIWRVKKHEHCDAAQDSSAEARRERRQRKVGSFVLILTLLLLVTVSPSFINLAVKMACDLFELNCSFIETVTVLSRYLYMMEILNFVVNPIIYVWRIGMYRKALWKCLKGLGSTVSSSHEHNPTETLSRGNVDA